MIYIIGVSHKVQYIKLLDRNPGHDEFEKLLRKAISDLSPAFIGEEDSKEALARRNAVSIPKIVADELGIEHAFCDPNLAEREAIGYREIAEIQQSALEEFWSMSDESIVMARAIQMAVYFPKRERFWFEHLPLHRGDDGIFVCGDAHVESFGALLASQSIQSAALHREIGMADSEKTDVAQARKYLAEHPELRNWETC